ncbi:MAG: NUDIX domain-containing protein [Corynebacteriales bacterium]|nr:NUDIX domain-containing protein [Mycobacteriales bacterium]
MSLPRRLAYRCYRMMPGKLRTRMVRMFTPNFTVGAVVLLRDESSRLLMVRKPGERGWSLPGGLLNRHESPAAAARRELFEETGVEVSEVTSAQPNALLYPRAQQVDMVFTATVDSSVSLKPDRVEIEQAAWHDMSRLPEVTVATARLLAAFQSGPYADYLPDAPDSAQAIAALVKPAPKK